MQYATAPAVRRILVLAGALAAGLLALRCTRSGPETLTIERGTSGCLGSAVIDSFEIAPGGAVTWDGPGRSARRFLLTPAEQTALVDAMQLPDDDAEAQEFHYWLRVDGGDELFAGTARAQGLNRLLESALDRHLGEWLSALGEHQLLLAARVGERRYRVHVARDGVLTLKRGGTVLHREQLTREQQVLFYEHLLGRVAVPAEAGDMVGRLVVAGALLPVSLERGAGLELVWAALRDADSEP
ncbi:MAG: hypothetical protein JNL83_38600 [Myxococcales bacterium]|nr:hypothetical protein [Myxococcales bacterium]